MLRRAVDHIRNLKLSRIEGYALASGTNLIMLNQTLKRTKPEQKLQRLNLPSLASKKGLFHALSITFAGVLLPKKLDVIFEKGVLKPLEELNLKDGQRLRVMIESPLFGMLRDWTVDAQKIKDELREIHG